MKKAVFLLSLFVAGVCSDVFGKAYPTSREFYEEFTKPLADLVKEDAQIKVEAYKKWYAYAKSQKIIKEYGSQELYEHVKEDIEQGVADPFIDRIPSFGRYFFELREKAVTPLEQKGRHYTLQYFTVVSTPIPYVYKTLNIDTLFNECNDFESARNRMNEQHTELKKLKNEDFKNMLDEQDFVTSKNVQKEKELFGKEPIENVVRCEATSLAKAFAKKYDITAATVKNRYFKPAALIKRDIYAPEVIDYRTRLHDMYERFINWVYPSQEKADVE